jgi:hypothetical protein
MKHRAQVEELMLELFTNPERPIAQRIGAVQFFLDRVGKELRLYTIEPASLVEQAEIVLNEDIEDAASKSDVTKFWSMIVKLIDQASEYIPPFPEQVPTLEQVLDAINGVWEIVFADINYEALDFFALRQKMMQLRTIELALRRHQELYGEYI